MNILYIAFSCQPNKGSEEKIGWSIPMESAKNNNVCVITREEQRNKIEAYLKENALSNIKFYFVDINNIYKKLLKGPLFSLRLNKLHKKAFPLARKICQEEKIDVIHQITPVEFRSIGNYSKIKNVKFICGPVGGGEYIPRGLRSYAKGKVIQELFRRFLNIWFKLKYMFTGKLLKCDYLMFANHETKKYLSKLTTDIKSSLFTEIGISREELEEREKESKIKKSNQFVILVAGHIAYRKGHAFLFEALKNIPAEYDYVCRVVGDGPYEKKIKHVCKKLNIENKVVFCGRATYEEMSKEYKTADVLVMPSLRETTGTVVLEAMSYGLPVITLNKYGALNMVDDSSAWLINGSSKKEYVCNLKDIIVECMRNPEEVDKRGRVAKLLACNHTWDKKISHYQKLYEKIANDRV